MSVETAAAKLGAKTIAIIVLVVAGLIGLGVIGWIWKDYQALKAKDKATESRQITTETIGDAQAQAQGTIDTVRVVVEQARQEKDARYYETLKTDSSAKSWADEPIPDSVRNIERDSLD